MTETTNYRLKKPAPEDFYDIGDQNANMDAIDAALKDHNDALERKAELGENGIVPEAQLPAFSKLTLGETADTAYRGDRGKLAYDHSTDGGKHVAQEERAAWNAKETPAGAQAKADAALEAARTELDGKADLVEGRIPVSQLPADVGLALGETEHTAYRGDRGKAAYDHISDGVKHVTASERTAWNGKLDAAEKGAANGVAPLGADGKVPDGYLNAQGGLVAQEAAPENQKLGWIDTGNGNILKFYDGEKWAAVNAVWG